MSDYVTVHTTLDTPAEEPTETATLDAAAIEAAEKWRREFQPAASQPCSQCEGTGQCETYPPGHLADSWDGAGNPVTYMDQCNNCDDTGVVPPPTVPAREWWAQVWPSVTVFGLCGGLYASESQAQHACSPGQTAVPVREVLPGDECERLRRDLAKAKEVIAKLAADRRADRLARQEAEHKLAESRQRQGDQWAELMRLAELLYLAKAEEA